MAFNFFKKKPAPAAPHKSDPLYYNLVVRNVSYPTNDSCYIEFEQSAVEKITYAAGQFLSFVLTIDGVEYTRSYSMCTSPTVDEYIAVAVKRVPNGKVSNWLVDNVSVGMTLRAMKPAGHFTFEMKPSDRRDWVCIAGGSGITPILSIIKTVLAVEPQSRCILIYANQEEGGIMFRETLDQLVKQYTNRLKIYHVIEFPSTSWRGRTGQIDEAWIGEIFQQEKIEPAARFLLCGPQPMMHVAQAILEKYNIPASQIFKENFTPQAQATQISPPPAGDVCHEVTLLNGNDTYVITVPANKTILSEAIKQALPIPHACQQGVCTACRGKLLSGEVDMGDQDGLSATEIANGYVLICVSKPVSNNIKIEIG